MSARKVQLNNSELLTWARESAGLTVEELARKVGMRDRPDRVVAWEAGDDAPTFRQLERLARAVRRSVAVLYLPEPPEEPSPPKDYRRLPEALSGSFSPRALLAFRELRNGLSDAREVAGLVGQPASLDLPVVGLGSDPQTAAETLRVGIGVSVAEQLGWSDEYDALNSWRSVLYDRGVLVQQFPVSVDELRGFSVLESGLGGIGLSSKDHPHARIFSMFHEVAHLCLREPGVSADASTLSESDPAHEAKVERYCDRFSAAFLLPSRSALVLESLAQLSEAFDYFHARRLSGRFKVSKYVMARRALDLGLITPRLHWTEVDRWLAEDRLRGGRRKSEGGPSFVQTAVSYRGKRFVSAVLEAMERHAISGHDAASLVGISPAHLDEARLLVT